jgi:L-seryl-tRNA(Ser) seleniumtransferase
MSKSTTAPNTVLRLIPSVDQLLRTETAQKLKKSIGAKQLTAMSRMVVADIRALVRSGVAIAGKPLDRHTAETLLQEAQRKLEEGSERDRSTGLTQVVNATGVVLHTNLGRAPLSDEALHAIKNASRYCNLEYDVFSGSRGRRGARVESLLAQLTGAEDSLVVNNCASAALLILTVLAKDGETIVSRGELVEIGGDFRIPEVMSTSGTRMVEVGTTNRTHLEDYRRAITGETRLLMRVHPSNYRIVGFASSPDLSELVHLAREANLPLYEDAGSGQINDLSAYGVADEFTIRQLIDAGVDVISFSGDKLLGSVQAGLIVGKTTIVSRLRKHPLYRALRSDKLRLAALESALDAYHRELEHNTLPVTRMLSLTSDEIAQRAHQLVADVNNKADGSLRMEITHSESAIGGGAGPTSKLKTAVIALTHTVLSADEIERHLRSSKPPIIARISEGQVLLDLRTVFDDEEQFLIESLKGLQQLN